MLNFFHHPRKIIFYSKLEIRSFSSESLDNYYVLRQILSFRTHFTSPVTFENVTKFRDPQVIQIYENALIYFFTRFMQYLNTLTLTQAQALPLVRYLLCRVFVGCILAVFHIVGKYPKIKIIKSNLFIKKISLNSLLFSIDNYLRVSTARNVFNTLNFNAFLSVSLLMTVLSQGDLFLRKQWHKINFF